MERTVGPLESDLRGESTLTSEPAPVIWCATSGRHASQRRRIAVALLVAGLRAELELPTAELERRAREHPGSTPDVLVVECDLRREDYRALWRLGRLMPYARCVVVTPITNPVAVRRALEIGAKAVVDELALEQTLGPAVRAVAAGLLALPPTARSSAEKPIFTHREKETLALVVDGLTNSEIALRLQVSESTVKSHLASVFGKLGVHSRSEAAALVLDPESGLASVALPPRRRHSSRPGVRLGW
jgi:DNA-binding NarL/FixJ family response regulator